MNDEKDLLRVVNSVAPIRICDNGGWTDTWFARYGHIFNIAVRPYVQVQMRVFRHVGKRARITIIAENYGQQYTIAEPEGLYDKHPLLEAAIARAREKGCAELQVNRPSEMGYPVYLRHGWQDLGRHLNLYPGRQPAG